MIATFTTNMNPHRKHVIVPNMLWLHVEKMLQFHDHILRNVTKRYFEIRINNSTNNVILDNVLQIHCQKKIQYYYL